MPTFKGAIAFDPSDAIPVGMISPLEPISRDDEPSGWYTTLDNPQTYEAYPGKRFKVLNFLYQSNPLDLENVDPDPETGIIQRNFAFALDIVWFRDQFFEVTKSRIVINVIVVGNDAEKGINTENTFYLNANRQEELNRIFRPELPSLSEEEATLVIGYVVDIGLSPNAKRQLPSSSLRVSVMIAGNFQGRSINFAGPTYISSGTISDNFFGGGNYDPFSDAAYLALGVTYVPMLKTGIQVANADTTLNIEYSITQNDLDSGIIRSDVVGIPVFLGQGIGKIICVTKRPIDPPGYQIAKIGYGVSDPWSGYPFGGIDGEYIKSSDPLHFTVQPESAVDDFFFGALNAKIVSIGGSAESDAFINCPRFSYTRVLNNFGIVYIPKEEAKVGFTFYVTAHVAEDVSLFFTRTDGNNIIINNTGISRATGDFVFSPHEYYVRSDLLIRNWIKKRDIAGDGGISESDPLVDIPPFSSSVVSENAKVLPYQKIINQIRPLSPEEDASVHNFFGMRLAKLKIDSFLPVAERFPLGYFAAADKFATNSEGTSTVDGGIAYISPFGMVEILVPKSAIRDQTWFNTFFKNTILNPVVERDYSFRAANDNGFINLFYDLSSVTNSLVPDNDKIPYDHRLARALSQISVFSQNDPSSGVGICALNLLERRESGEWVTAQFDIVRNPPPITDNDANRMYYDLSNAYFDFESPMPRSMSLRFIQAQVGSRTGQNFIPGSLTAEAEWNPISPVNLKFNGRIYFEKTDPISVATGGNSEVNIPYVATVATSGKISTCLDYHGINGALISVGSFGGADVRSIYINGLLESQRRRSYIKDFNFPSLDIRTDIPDMTRPSWYGKSIDSIPLMPNGALVLRKKEPKSNSIDDPPLKGSTIAVRGSHGTRNVSFNNYQRGSWSREVRSEGFISFSLSDNILVETGRIRITGRLAADISSSSNFVNIAFSSSSSLFSADAMLFNNINVSETEITFDFKVPYYGGNLTVFGGALDSFEVSESIAELYTVDKNAVEKYKIDALDAAIAITAGGRYVAALAVNNPGGASVDLLVKEDENFMWKQIKNAVQSFSGESFASVMIRSAHNANKVFLSFSLNDCMFVKPINNDWLEDAANNYTAPVKNRFVLPDGSLYGLSGEKYGQIFNVNDVRTSFLQNRIRISPGYLVYGANSEFIQAEKDSFNNARKFSNTVKSGDEISARFYIGNEYASSDDDIKNLYNQSASGSYSFEVLPDGMLLFASVKDGGVLLRLSNDDGITWRSAFSHFPAGVPYRPLKFLKTDRGSFTREVSGKFSYINGACPSVDSISTALDLYGQRVAFCYSIRNMLFLQEVPISVFTLDCNKDFNRIFTTDQREDVVYGVSVLPSVIAGIVPSEYELPLINNQCDFSWRIDGPISRNNIGNLGNISLGGKAPSMIYLSNGALRLHFEGDRGEIRALTVTASTVKGDHIP